MPQLPSWLVHVIGKVSGTQNVEFNDPNEDKHRIKFDIEDLQGTQLAVTLWGTNAHQYHNYITVNGNNQMVVVVLQFAQINEYRGDIGVTTYYQATKFMMNPDIAEVDKFVATNGESGTSDITIISSETVSESDDFLKNNNFTQIMNITEPNKLKVC
ncbi:hypothetical protein L1887_31600 [Cichorium endivia]|nr:hypothetical protein L1887_31600 [Cichorium endivia]